MKKLVVCMVLGLASSARAQVATTGLAVGSVQDPSGAVVPGATLRLENENTKEVQSTAAGADGGLVFPIDVPGSYDLTVNMAGFQTAADIAIAVNAALHQRMEHGPFSPLRNPPGFSPP